MFEELPTWLTDLLPVTLSVAVLAGLIYPVAPRVEAVWRVVERYMIYMACAVIIFVMMYVCAEVMMRYVFNSPIPGHLEGSQLLVPIIVFLGVSYTQARNGHVGMNIVLDLVSENVRHMMVITTLFFSMMMCAMLAYFCGKFAIDHYIIDNVTETPPYFRTWPSSSTIALGFFVMSVRMYLQILQKLYPDWMPESEEDLSELKAE